MSVNTRTGGGGYPQQQQDSTADENNSDEESYYYYGTNTSRSYSTGRRLAKHKRRKEMSSPSSPYRTNHNDLQSIMANEHTSLLTPRTSSHRRGGVGALSASSSSLRSKGHNTIHASSSMLTIPQNMVAVSSSNTESSDEEFYHKFTHKRQPIPSQLLGSNSSKKNRSSSKKKGVMSGPSSTPRLMGTGPMITTLNDADEQRDVIRYSSLFVSELKLSRRWRWSFCISGVLAVLLFLICSCTAAYFMFFKSSHIYIDQIQVYHLPIDGWLGFQISINCYNPNAAPITVQSVALELSLFDPTQSITYMFEEPVEHNWNSTNEATISRWSTQNLVIRPYIYIGSSPFFAQMQDLIVRKYQQEYILKGKITTRIGTFYHTQQLNKLQQYYVTEKSLDQHTICSIQKPFNKIREKAVIECSRHSMKSYQYFIEDQGIEELV